MKQESRPADDLRIELNAWIYRAENLNSILYTGESWSSLQTKVAGAKTVYDNQAATSKALADAISDIQTAIADLQKASGSGHDGDNEVGNYHVAVSKSILEKNKYVLYTVNCGTPDPFEVPGGRPGVRGRQKDRSSMGMRTGRRALCDSQRRKRRGRQWIILHLYVGQSSV